MYYWSLPQCEDESSASALQAECCWWLSAHLACFFWAAGFAGELSTSPLITSLVISFDVSPSFEFLLTLPKLLTARKTHSKCIGMPTLKYLSTFESMSQLDVFKYLPYFHPLCLLRNIRPVQFWFNKLPKHTHCFQPHASRGGHCGNRLLPQTRWKGRSGWWRGPWEKSGGCFPRKGRYEKICSWRVVTSLVGVLLPFPRASGLFLLSALWQCDFIASSKENPDWKQLREEEIYMAYNLRLQFIIIGMSRQKGKASHPQFNLEWINVSPCLLALAREWRCSQWAGSSHAI